MKDDRIDISFAAAHIEDSLLYGAGFGRNLLFCWNMENRELQSLAAFGRFQNFNGNHIAAVFRYGDQLFCFSKFSYVAAAWHLKEKSFTYYAPEEEAEEGMCIRSICRVGDDVWMLQKVTDSSAVVFSMRNGRFSRCTVNADLERHFQISEIISYGVENSVAAGNRIWRCIPGTDALLGFDTKSLETEIVKFHIPDTFYTIHEKDGWIYILGAGGKHVIAWNPDTREQTVWDTEYEGISDRPFREAVRAGNRLFLLPCFEEKIFCYEIRGDCISFISKLEYPAGFEKIHDPQNRSMFLGSVFTDKNLLYLFPMAGNGLLSLHTESMKMSLFPIQLSKNEYISVQTNAGNIIPEYQIDLQDYLEFIEAGKKDFRQNGGYEDYAGTRCWNALKK